MRRMKIQCQYLMCAVARNRMSSSAEDVAPFLSTKRYILEAGMNAYVAYYPTKDAYATWSGFLLVQNGPNPGEPAFPALHLNNDTITGYRRRLSLAAPSDRAIVKLRNTSIQEGALLKPDGSGTHVQKVGPFLTFGGYSTTEASISVLSGPMGVFRNRSDGIFVTQQLFQIVNRYGVAIGLPPMHLHHLHVNLGFSAYLRDLSRCRRPGGTIHCDSSLGHSAMLFELTGDTQCLPSEGGLTCWAETYPAGYGKLWKDPVDMNWAINDVRLPSSRPLLWSTQIIFRWLPKRPVQKLLSYLEIQPNLLISKGIRQIPRGREAFVWYNSHYLHSGKVIDVRIHSHGGSFEAVWLFHASTDELGLTDPRFQTKFEGEPLEPHIVNMTSNADVKSHVLKHLHIARARCGTANMSGSCPSRVCSAYANNEIINSIAYYRKPALSCKLSRITLGNPFVIMSFYSGQPDRPADTFTQGEYLGQHPGQVSITYYSDDGAFHSGFQRPYPSLGVPNT